MAATVYVLTAALGVMFTAAGAWGMLGHHWTVELTWLVPLGGVRLAIDPLAGLFVALIGATSVTTSVYAVGYSGGSRRGLLAYPTFVLAMAAVALAGNVMTFAIAWEVMSLASYFLVVDGARDEAAQRAASNAAWVYAVMTHAGVLALLAGMLLMTAWSGSADFGEWRHTAAGLSPAARTVVWGLLAAGFASKAGVIPLHVWLPLAHPAAPSHVSALMSGVMIKLGVYGLLRASFDWLGVGPVSWGIVIMVAGAASAVIGILYALADRDLKRLLAFSSIENVGVILVGVGAGSLYHAAGRSELAVLSLAAALYHAVNHAVFKALLFLGGGSVVHATGTRDMEMLGGLIKRMPWTAATFLIGAMSIAALPPLNGFVSEWLTFQALLHEPHVAGSGIALVFAVGIAAIALTAGLAVPCFVKAFGITFLALPRNEAAETAHESTISMRLAMAVLAAACVALGLGATLAVPVLSRVAAAALGTDVTLDLGDWLTLRASGDFASVSTLAIALGLVVAVVPLALTGARRPHRSYETWACGRMVQTARMQYTATAFANPFTRIFDFFYRPVKRLDIEFHPESRFFVSRIQYENPTRSIFEEWLYRPVLDGLRVVSRGARAIQSGNTNLYLIYILAVLLALLIFA
jgi:formate hydrogenlyase subunit 3/multisubunit Na+/H+ antiporter MnhD subunit